MLLAQEYEGLWESSDSAPDVFSFLAEQRELRADEQVQILLIDQSRRWKCDAPLTVEDYLQRMPELGSDPEVKLQLAVGEFQARQDVETLPSIDDFTSRFSDISDQLRSKLSELAWDDQPADLTAVVGHVEQLEPTRTFGKPGQSNQLDATEDFGGDVGQVRPKTTQVFVSGQAAGNRTFGRYRLERILGEGAFGRVYLAYDDELQRQVAIKVPTEERFKRPEDAEQYLSEARTVASLNHPNIVPVYDTGRTDDGSIYVVSKFIEGQTLADRIRRKRGSPDESAALLATVAQALHHAHQLRLIHRDVKPGNILLEGSKATPYVADFGLAIREEDFLRDRRLAGTPAYMSPEQVRGESHRLDGRSDIFSLGVVLYELLTGKKPFQGSTAHELFQLIISADPQPPRDLDDSIPAELERICLKSLCKQASDRYATAADLADDLQHWTESQQQETRELQIVPKGLRSFDAEDADFFLDLLPGPRNRSGLPESIQFWKTRLEETDPDKTFSVGLIYGPSGCGKSSLVKAGLLPRLSKEVTPIYVEATPDETESRILRGLRNALPNPPDNLGLAEALMLIRRTEGSKVVVVLDQFEQWLHAHRAYHETELVSALRQADGAQVQAVVMVRDDFVMAAARFMDKLDIPIVQGRNFATVDLFDVDHSRRVLIKFGQAYEKLPNESSRMNEDEKSFVRSAASGLARDGQVVSVRLALFAEMVKGKIWVPSTLDEVGGTEGIGVHFLEETFSSITASPEHRLHENAAREVLKVLLPEVGSDIKGQMRARDELLNASGYQSSTDKFNDLLRILDGELRLITPTERVENGEWRVAGGEEGVGRQEGGLGDGSSKLSATGCLAARNGTGGKVLPSDRQFPSSGDVWPADPNQAGCGVDPGEHRRGTGTRAHKEVSAPPEHRAGVTDGDVDTTANQPSREPDEANAVGGSADSVGSHQQDTQRSPEVFEKESFPLTPSASSSTNHPSHTTRHSFTLHYQLTHDYLVPSLRDWLTRKQRETRQGRAELKLAERSALWNDKPKNRHLPSLPEWTGIWTLTDRRKWTVPQRKMMRQAGHVLGMYSGLTAIAVVLITIAGLSIAARVEERQNADHARALVASLSALNTADLREKADEIAEYQPWTIPLLREIATDEQAGTTGKLHASLLLAEHDPTQVEFLFPQLLAASPDTVRVIRSFLERHQKQLEEQLSNTIQDGSAGERIRAAAALAEYDAEHLVWQEESEAVVSALLAGPAAESDDWTELLAPVGGFLAGPLQRRFQNVDEQNSSSERPVMAAALANYLQDEPEMLIPLILLADSHVEFQPLLAALRNHPQDAVANLQSLMNQLPPDEATTDENNAFRKKQANAAICLLELGDAESVWPLFQQTLDPSLRSLLIDRMARLGADPDLVAARIGQESNPASRYALILGLGQYGEQNMSSEQQQAYSDQLASLYHDDPDSGVHSAAGWTLRNWQQGDFADRIDSEGQAASQPQHNWYINSQGQTFALIRGPVEFSKSEVEFLEVGKQKEEWNKVTLSHSFAIATHEVNVEQFRRFRSDHLSDDWVSTRPESQPDRAVTRINWVGAAMYCNWLSEQEGIPQDQWCYALEFSGSYATNIRVEDFRSRNGYRLPTDEEWQLACWAGATSGFAFGEPVELLQHYGWYADNSESQIWPSGLKLPNRWGIFDMHGNAEEWCHDGYSEKNLSPEHQEIHRRQAYHKYSGGSFASNQQEIRSRKRGAGPAVTGGYSRGFRLARTDVAVSSASSNVAL